MGSGKTSAAINYMNSHSKQKFMFVTQYLDEVKRIMDACPKLKFKQPVDFGIGKKESLNDLLRKNDNIATTHSLLQKLPDETLNLIKNGNYTLILDEVIDAVAVFDVLKGDIDFLLDCGAIDVDTSKNVMWVFNKEYTGTMCKELMEKCQKDTIVYNNRNLFFWFLTKELFDVFDNTYILTYMFDAQFQKYYFDIYNIKFSYIGVKMERKKYIFVMNEEDITIPDYTKKLYEKIHIVNNVDMNRVGENFHDLSAGWYKRNIKNNSSDIEGLKNNISLFFRKSEGCKSGNSLWTMWKKYRKIFSSDGYIRSFTTFSLRATNKYSNRRFLAYCVNVFMNPNLKLSCTDKGVDVKENMYSLSMMIQWIWRSAIRNGEEIWLYIPSCRMRCLLKMWLNDLKNGGDGRSLNYKNIDKNIDDNICGYYLDPRSKCVVRKENNAMFLAKYFKNHVKDILGESFEFVDFIPDRFKTFQYLVTNGENQYPVFITSQKIYSDIYRKSRTYSKYYKTPYCFCIGAGLYRSPAPSYINFIDYHSWDIELET